MHNACCTGTYLVNLALDDKQLNDVKDAFNAAANEVHKNKGFTSKHLKNKAVKKLTKATYKVLNEAVKETVKTEIPEDMLRMLQNDVFIFSGMKTYAQLKETSLLLMDDTGNIKPVSSFINDVQKINKTYNENYLRAEHQFAISSSQSAAQWHSYAKDGDRYNLQIRTAGDDKVRKEHALLNNITLSQSDKFWVTHWTPFDWGCRCRIIQVLKSKYEISDTETAIAAGKKAVPEMFRYNPGIEKIVFPPKHPYYKLSKEALNVVKNDKP